ncbi:hypothetical protein [Psychrobacter sanguinis]|uniref:hypothetical protein n=1 Tax=Psychrobacter sanguinis TaxID=861445 RepID=UPI00289A4ACA|nr:hypothetical protein [Psychrobacter sanguinis]
MAGHSDVTTATKESLNEPLENSFDASTVNEELGAQVEITRAFGQEAPKAVAEFSQNRIDDIKADPNLSIDEKLAEIEKWNEGGVYRVAAHTAIGALGTGNLEGSLTTGSVAAAAPKISEYESKLADALISSGMSPEAANATSKGVTTLTLAGIGATAGLNTSSTATGINVDANNRQLHPKEEDLAKVLFDKAKKDGLRRSDGKLYTLKQIEDALRWANSSKYGEEFDDKKGVIIGHKASNEAINKVMYDHGLGSQYEARLWLKTKTTPQTSTFIQNFSNIAKPDTNLTSFIKSYTKSYGYTWTQGTYTKYTPPKQVATTSSKPKLPTKSTNPAKKYTDRDLSNQRAATLNNNGSVLPGKLPEQQQRDNAATAKKVGTLVEVGTVVTTGGAGLTVGLGRTGLKQATKQVIKETAKNAGKGAASGAVIGGTSYYAVTPTEDRSLEKGIKYATGGAVTGVAANTIKNPYISGGVSGIGTGLTQVYAGDDVDIPSAVVNGTTGGILKPFNLGSKGDVIQGVATTAVGERSKIDISSDTPNDINKNK